MSRRTIRVLLVEDHVLVRREVAHLLGECPDIEIVGEASNGRAAIELARALYPDLVLMDVFMPTMGGIEATRILHSEMPDVQVIGLSTNDEIEIANAMRAAGAVAYLIKSVPAEELIEAVRACSLTFR